MTHATTTAPDSAHRSLSAAEVQLVAGGPLIRNDPELVAPSPVRELSAAEVVAVAGGPLIINDPN